jgi:hypothetical protein
MASAKVVLPKKIVIVRRTVRVAIRRTVTVRRVPVRR